jgi:5-methylcytosine-specific restriction endonuclease McrA
MSRRHISTRDRAKIFAGEGGVCHVCLGKIQVGEAWDVSHEIPLALGGDDCGDNLRVAHRKCHASVTRVEDIPAIAKAKRREAAHTGTKAKSRRPMPGSRASGLRKRMDGRVERRND